MSLRTVSRALVVLAVLLLASVPVLAQSSDVPGQPTEVPRETTEDAHQHHTDANAEVPGQHIEVPEGTTEDAHQLHAEAYAEDTGVDIDEAKRRLELQSIVMELTAQLMTRERDVMGDMRIEHLPDFHVVISVVPGGEEQVRPYIEGGPLSDITTFEIVEYTKDQLRADLERTDELLAPYDILYGAAVTEREVQIFVLEDVEALQQRLDKDGVVLPPTVQLVQALGPDVDDATVIGGLASAVTGAGWWGDIIDPSRSTARL